MYTIFYAFVTQLISLDCISITRREIKLAPNPVVCDSNCSRYCCHCENTLLRFGFSPSPSTYCWNASSLFAYTPPLNTFTGEPEKPLYQPVPINPPSGIQ